MQKNISFREQSKEAAPESAQKGPTSKRDVILARLGYRGLEVLENAEHQFPNETKLVIEKLAELVESGEINEELDGGKLLALFRSVGLSVRMNTKINIEQDGKFVSLSDKLRSESNEGDTQRA